MNFSNKMIYLDTNVIEILREPKIIGDTTKDEIEKQVHEKLKNTYHLLKEKFMFPYSPAHIEEIEVMYRGKNADTELVDKKMHFISVISHNYELYAPEGKVILKEEKPSVCMKRVTDVYEDTLLAEANDKFFHAYRDEKSFKAYFQDLENLNTLKRLQSYCEEKYQQKEIYGLAYILISSYIEEFSKIRNKLRSSLPISDNQKLFTNLRTKYSFDNAQELRDISPEDIFNKKEVIYFIESENEEIDLSLKYNDLKDSHQRLENHLESLFKILEQIGYKSEGKNKSRSAMHDMTHAIYATKADYFVTRDKKFGQKTKAIYHHLGIKTEVLTIDDFCKNKFV
jgi:hypothetical protein